MSELLCVRCWLSDHPEHDAPPVRVLVTSTISCVRCGMGLCGSQGVRPMSTKPPVAWWPKILWSDCYRGLEIGRIWIGWTNPVYKRHGW